LVGATSLVLVFLLLSAGQFPPVIGWSIQSYGVLDLACPPCYATLIACFCLGPNPTAHATRARPLSPCCQFATFHNGASASPSSHYDCSAGRNCQRVLRWDPAFQQESFFTASTLSVSASFDNFTIIERPLTCDCFGPALTSRYTGILACDSRQVGDCLGLDSEYCK
jgi:hypothetical protein